LYSADSSFIGRFNLLIRFKNYRNSIDGRNDNENSIIYGTCYLGPFKLDNNETEKVFWKNIGETWGEMNSRPENYTSAFINSLENYLFKGIKAN